MPFELTGDKEFLERRDLELEEGERRLIRGGLGGLGALEAFLRNGERLFDLKWQFYIILGSVKSLQCQCFH